VTIVGSPSALAAASDVLISVVTSNSALDAARQTAPFLKRGQLYADLNSVSPAVKQELEVTVSSAGGAFVEVAVMAPVQPARHRVPMLVGGPAAHDFADAMSPFGMRLHTLSGPIGTAAAVKMCRSIVVKGLEALIVECVLAATRYGADEHVFRSLDESFPGVDWKRAADYMVGRVVEHGERRAREMEEVAETLRAVGIDPIMSVAAAARQESVARMGLLPGSGRVPGTYVEFVEAVTGSSKARTSSRRGGPVEPNPPELPV
jgi:3-hydroxyisobutyrate dehydrogenase